MQQTPRSTSKNKNDVDKSEIRTRAGCPTRRPQYSYCKLLHLSLAPQTARPSCLMLSILIMVICALIARTRVTEQVSRRPWIIRCVRVRSKRQLLKGTKSSSPVNLGRGQPLCPMLDSDRVERTFHLFCHPRGRGNAQTLACNETQCLCLPTFLSQATSTEHTYKENSINRRGRRYDPSVSTGVMVTTGVTKGATRRIRKAQSQSSPTKPAHFDHLPPPKRPAWIIISSTDNHHQDIHVNVFL